MTGLERRAARSFPLCSGLLLSLGNSFQMLAFFRVLLALRHQRIVPLLNGIGGGGGSFRREGSVTAVEWVLKDRATLLLIANLSEKPAQYRRRRQPIGFFRWDRPPMRLYLPGPSSPASNPRSIEFSFSRK